MESRSGSLPLRREMDRLWEDFRPGPRGLRPWTEEWTPAVDVPETPEKVTIQAEVPGLDPKDIDISLVGDLLTIKGEKKSEREETKENYHLWSAATAPFPGPCGCPLEWTPTRLKPDTTKGS